MKKHSKRAYAFAAFTVLLILAIGLTGLYLKSRYEWGTKSAQDFASVGDLVAFLQANGSGMTESEMDEAVIRLLELQSAALKEHEEQILSDAVNPLINRYSPDDLARVDTIQEEDLRKLVTDIHSDRLRISSSEGMAYLEIDYPWIRSRFGPYTTESMAAYLDIMARETDRRFAEDAALMVGPDELAARLIAIEEFVNENPDFAFLTDVKRLQSYYLPALLLGLNNTPAFSYKTNRIGESYLACYRAVIQKHEGTRLAGLVQEYLRLLEQNRFEKTGAVLDFVKGATDRL